jgi:flavodoxin
VNVGIIVFSRTGNTLSVAERVRDACLARGHAAAIERVLPENEDPRARQPVRLKGAPDPSRFDCVIFAGPVEAFSLSPVIKAYMQKLPAIAGKRVGCFVTQQFPKPWLGGNHAIRQMRALCASKGAEVLETGIVHWGSKSREEQIAGIASRFGAIGG